MLLFSLQNPLSISLRYNPYVSSPRRRNFFRSLDDGTSIGRWRGNVFEDQRGWPQAFDAATPRVLPQQRGYRLMARRAPVGICPLNRRGNDWSPRYLLVLEAVNALKVRSCLIDGEVMRCNDDGVAEFQSEAIDGDSSSRLRCRSHSRVSSRRFSSS
jgi:hypothetical protein